MSAATWIASSRVGTRTSAPGGAFAPAVRSTSGSAEGERLAGAGRRLGEDVESGERVREDEALDGEGMRDPRRCERTDDRRADAELLEGLGHVFDSFLIGMFETQLTSNNLKRRNEKPDLHGAGWLSVLSR